MPVLLVSHDRAFLDNVVTSTLAFEGNGRVQEYVGGWEDYLRQTAGARRPGGGDRDLSVGARRSALGVGEGDASAGVRRSALGARDDGSAKKKLSYNEQRELEWLPGQIETLENEQAALKAELESPEFYKASSDRIKQVMTRLEDGA